MTPLSEKANGSRGKHRGGPSHTSRSQFRGRSKRASERLIELLLVASGAASVFTTLGILYTLSAETVAFFREVSLIEFLTHTEWTPLFTDKHFGILPLVAGTLLTSGIAVAVALPSG
jgi:phosphate transport system permease protein